MPKQKNNFPNYYDGSAHVEFAEELAEKMEPKHNEEVVNQEEWRRNVSANPFGAADHS